jgi:hypothetical protein
MGYTLSTLLPPVALSADAVAIAASIASMAAEAADYHVEAARDAVELAAAPVVGEATPGTTQEEPAQRSPSPKNARDHGSLKLPRVRETGTSGRSRVPPTCGTKGGGSPFATTKPPSQQQSLQVAQVAWGFPRPVPGIVYAVKEVRAQVAAQLKFALQVIDEMGVGAASKGTAAEPGGEARRSTGKASAAGAGSGSGAGAGSGRSRGGGSRGTKKAAGAAAAGAGSAVASMASLGPRSKREVAAIRVGRAGVGAVVDAAFARFFPASVSVGPVRGRKQAGLMRRRNIWV